MNFNKIIHPLTNESLSIFSTTGKNLLKDYVKLFKTGGMNDNNNDNNVPEQPKLVPRTPNTITQEFLVEDDDLEIEINESDTVEYIIKKIKEQIEDTNTYQAISFGNILKLKDNIYNIFRDNRHGGNLIPSYESSNDDELLDLINNNEAYDGEGTDYIFIEKLAPDHYDNN